jgi:hypothetical protein
LRVELVLAALVLGFAGFITSKIRDARARTHRREERAALMRDTTMIGAGLVQGTVRRAFVPPGKGQTTAPAELRSRVYNLSPGTYVNDILAEQDSALYRWPERMSDALRVYVEPTSTIAGFDPMYPDLARTIFDEWSRAGFPLRFTFIFDSTSADITIRWVDHFGTEEGQRIGVTERTQTSQFLIARARVAIANHDSTGRALAITTVGGILRHEIGHALGLNHARDPTSVMFRESATMTIGNSDRATLRLLYLVSGGSLKE